LSQRLRPAAGAKGGREILLAAGPGGVEFAVVGPGGSESGPSAEKAPLMKTSIPLVLLSLFVAMPAAAGVVVTPSVPEPTSLGIFAVGAAVVAIGYRIGRNR
jgi:hypothetical protein